MDRKGLKNVQLFRHNSDLPGVLGSFSLYHTYRYFFILFLKFHVSIFYSNMSVIIYLQAVMKTAKNVTSLLVHKKSSFVVHC